MSKPGRKPLMEGQPTDTVTVRLPLSMHDDLCRLALKRDIPVSALIRQGLQRFLQDERGACLSL